MIYGSEKITTARRYVKLMMRSERRRNELAAFLRAWLAAVEGNDVERQMAVPGMVGMWLNWNPLRFSHEARVELWERYVEEREGARNLGRIRIRRVS